MRDARELARSAQLDVAKSARYVGSLECRLVLHLLGKGKHSIAKAEFASIDAIGDAFIAQVNADAVAKVERPKSWAGAGKNAPPIAAATGDVAQEKNISKLSVHGHCR